MDGCDLIREYWIPGTGFMDACEPPLCWCWEENPGPLKELFTALASLQSHAVLAVNPCFLSLLFKRKPCLFNGFLSFINTVFCPHERMCTICMLNAHGGQEGRQIPPNWI